ncbi:uncharacterized protein LOC119728209 [Patiria miniata]|uniref:non-specific serine/threonine protein kinase n=1 Tax=Patiria miniata TaxID=46514 RepID=A0A913ZYY4_PATMI|nr:uncharacterized protein LOC119728209 [Patiria miniata]XP_038056277.1 uncharacterized protein LOC119728209 [Patiria miniata]
MLFHPRCHGANIQLSKDGTTATRVNGFSHAIVFSSEPLEPGRRVSFEFCKYETCWNGALRVGLTNRNPDGLDPGALPQYLLPNLTDLPGSWAKSVPESKAKTENLFSLFYTRERVVQFFINNEHLQQYQLPQGSVDVNRPVWVILDLYGWTVSLRCIQPIKDDVPSEVLARGPEAAAAFQVAANSGTKAVHRTRLMIIGQAGAGKTCLRRALLGQSCVSEETSTGGIDTTQHCHIIDHDGRHTWQEQPLEKNDEEKGKDTTAEIEEEYAQAIALNITHELLRRKHKENNILSRGRQDDNSKAKDEGVEGEEKGVQEVTKGEERPDETRKEQEEDKQEPEIISDLEVTDSNRMSEIDSPDLSDGKDHIYRPKGGVDPTLAEFTSSLDKLVAERVAALVDEYLKRSEKMEDNLKEKIEDGGPRSIDLSIWDFTGQSMYYTLHQVYLSSRAIYLLTFDLTKDLDAPIQSHADGCSEQVEWSQGKFTNLDHIDFWLRSVHAHTAENARNVPGNTALSPPIFIVGTHRDGLGSDPAERDRLVADKFRAIRACAQGKPYQSHIIPTYFAVENCADNTDEEIVKLRECIESVATKEPYMGEHIPLKWLRFEHSLAEVVMKGTNYLPSEKMRQMAGDVGVSSDQGVATMLQFYHDLGVVIYNPVPGSSDASLQNMIILRPHWLVEVFKKITVANQEDAEFAPCWKHLQEQGILEDRLVDHLWAETLEQKPALLGLMEKFDLLCRDHKAKGQMLYYMPSCLKEMTNREELVTDAKTAVVFYITFGGFLPVGLFHRLVVHACRWSQEHGDQSPKLTYRQARFFVDEQQDFVLEMAPVRFARLKVTVMKAERSDEGGSRRMSSKGPVGQKACAKVRHFLDSALSDLRASWMKRLSHCFSVTCPCSKRCSLHGTEGCKRPTCLHFLNLDECLASSFVMCEHRQVKTSTFRKWFPKEKPTIVPLTLTTPSRKDKITEDNIPPWVKAASKLLNSGCDGSDWLALATKLGYKKAKIQKFQDELNPALVLILDWIQNSGNTALSLEMMVSYLEQMQREDVIDVIQKGQESNAPAPTVFISYNWGIQEEVCLMRDHLERAGFPCWMDIGQMGGGDALYAKIYEGIRNAKAVLVCVTPQYVLSESCNREVCLADLLKKPIIPVMFGKVPWPPPGGLALIFSRLIYVDIHGVGGHGGSGRKADIETKYNDIISQIRPHANPVEPKPILQIERAGSDHCTAETASANGSQTSQPLLPSSRVQQQQQQQQGQDGETAEGEQRQAPRAAVTNCVVCAIL